MSDKTFEQKWYASNRALHSAWNERDELLKEREKLYSALRLALRWMGDSDDPTGTFEDIGDWFYRDTGYLRPGKSEPLECGGRDEERQAAWEAWVKKTRAHVRKTCASLLPSDEAKP